MAKYFISLVLALMAPMGVLSFSNVAVVTRGRQGMSMRAPKPSGFSSTKEGKAVILERTKVLVDKSALIIAVPGQGITKEQIDLLRKDLPETTTASVVKNSLLTRAVEGTPFAEVAVDLRDQNLFLFVAEGEAKPTYKAFKAWQKETKRTDPSTLPKVAAMEGTSYKGADAIESLCSLPTKTELIAKIAMGIKSVPTKLGRGVKAVPEKLGRAVRAIKDKLEEEEKA
eukprot:CAMPEP_0182428660 /NCGR_PEP_ID=MMETSP1167-20130531/23186_1 /TAXON_ID=2988 /ORGANISM="Mallomonas Sp, Strain CCMP3275" /LENGTH=226 /DNA_ID=CAMNT_0024611671 /DNA_START=63 /DNA_END=743 /DNA_ORIENTATION=-